MDWTPTDPTGNQNTDDGSWMRPQRFFAPEKPTGLEDLLQRAHLVEDVTMSDATEQASHWWGRILDTISFRQTRNKDM